jgi:TPP-dependent pyruvate/acetoin dehydrogenase alpha subunit
VNNPGLTRRQLVELYRYISSAQHVERKLVDLSGGRGVAGGQPWRADWVASSVGAAYALSRGDLLAARNNRAAGLHDVGALLVRGVTPREIFLRHLERNGSPGSGKSPDLTDLERGVLGGGTAPGAMIPVMAGVALAARARGGGRVALVLVGEAETTTGHFHEGVSLAAVRRAPLVVLVLRDGVSGEPAARRGRAGPGVERAVAYGLPSEVIDGGDVLAVYEAAGRAVTRAREGAGSAMLEAEMIRPPRRVRRSDAAEGAAGVDERRRRDPIDRYRSWLLRSEGMDEEVLERIDSVIEAEVTEESGRALDAPMPEATTVGEGVTGVSAGAQETTAGAALHGPAPTE